VVLEVFGITSPAGTITKDCQGDQYEQGDKNDHNGKFDYCQKEAYEGDELPKQGNY
jgi:hypothetical protein